jgi:hypothetical protein
VEWATAQNLTVIRQRTPGIRQGYKEALPYIEGDIIITFSPDGNSLAEKIPELIAKMHEGFDMVIGSRYLGEARSEDDDLITGFGNWFFTKTVNVLFGGRYSDVMVMFRAYRKQLIYELRLDKDDYFTWVERLFRIRSGSLSWEPILSVLGLKYGYRVGEIPASEPKRIGGQRKLRVMQWGGACYLQFLREFIKRRVPAGVAAAASARRGVGGSRTSGRTSGSSRTSFR